MIREQLQDLLRGTASSEPSDDAAASLEERLGAAASAAWLHKTDVARVLGDGDIYDCLPLPESTSEDWLVYIFVLHACRFNRDFGTLNTVRHVDFPERPHPALRYTLQAFSLLSVLAECKGEVSKDLTEKVEGVASAAMVTGVRPGVVPKLWQQKVLAVMFTGLRYRESQSAAEILWRLHHKYYASVTDDWGHSLMMVTTCIRLGKLEDADRFLEASRVHLPRAEQEGAGQIFGMEQTLLNARLIQGQMERDREELKAYADRRAAEMDEKVSGYIYSTLEVTALLLTLLGLLISFSPAFSDASSTTDVVRSAVYAGTTIVVFIVLLRLVVGPNRIRFRR